MASPRRSSPSAQHSASRRNDSQDRRNRGGPPPPPDESLEEEWSSPASDEYGAVDEEGGDTERNSEEEVRRGSREQGHRASGSQEQARRGSGSQARRDSREPPPRGSHGGDSQASTTGVPPKDGTGEHPDGEDSPEATRAGPPVTLEITEGPDRGRRKRFAGVRMVIGRSSGCDLELSDQSVSRRHVELVYGDKGVMLRDLGSGNGTRVNGERVSERVLVHDDEIAIGQTRLRLIDEQERLRRLREEEAAREEAERKEREEAAERKAREEAERKAREEAERAAQPEGAAAAGAPPSPSRPGVGAAESAPARLRARLKRQLQRLLPTKERRRRAFVVLGVLLLGMGWWWHAHRVPKPDEKHLQAVAKMDEAEVAMREGEYAKVVSLAKEAEALSPGVDTKKLAAQAAHELVVLEGLQAVRDLIAKEELEQARARLTSIPPGQLQRSKQERAKLEAELSAREVAALVKVVEGRLARRELEGLRQLIYRLPAHRQVGALHELAKLEKELERERQERARQELEEQRLAQLRAQQRRQAALEEAFRKVDSRFHEGDYRRAVLECDRVIDAQGRDAEMRERAEQLKKLIPRFSLVWKDAQRKVRTGALESAVQPLRSASELYGRMGFRGALEDTLKAQLTKALVAAGRGASARSELVEAASRFREALELTPGEPLARDGLSRLQAKMEQMFVDASIIQHKDRELAVEKFRIIMQVAAEGSDVRRKAGEQLRLLQR